MTRKKSREQAFILIFEKSINNSDVEEILLAATECRNFECDEYCVNTFKGTYENLDSIDLLISEFLEGWKIERISKTSLALLRLAVYEMIYCSDIPVSVSINEAVELSKTYSTTDESAYINGVLGSISRRDTAEE